MKVIIAAFLVPSVLLSYLMGREWIETIHSAIDDAFED